MKYVPTTRANIISLGELASYKFACDEEFCNVFKSDNLVLQEKKKGKNIYYLDGCFLNDGSSRTKKT